MKKLTIAISVVAGIALSFGANAEEQSSGWSSGQNSGQTVHEIARSNIQWWKSGSASGQSGREIAGSHSQWKGSGHRAAHSGHEKQESNLRECVTKCTPSQCRHNRDLARYCTSVCHGHDMSLPKWLYRKCSMSSSGIRSSSIGEGNQGWEGGDYGSPESNQRIGGSQGQGQGHMISERSPAQHWQHSQDSGSTGPSWQAQQSQGSVGPVAQSEPISQGHGGRTAEGSLQTWQGSQDATLAERTASEAIDSSNPYGIADANTRLYGINERGELLSQSSITPKGSGDYASWEMLG